MKHCENCSDSCEYTLQQQYAFYITEHLKTAGIKKGVMAKHLGILPSAFTVYCRGERELSPLKFATFMSKVKEEIIKRRAKGIPAGEVA